MRTKRTLSLPQHVIKAGLLCVLAGCLAYFIPPSRVIIRVGMAGIISLIAYFILTSYVSRSMRILIASGLFGLGVLVFMELLTVLHLTLLLCILVCLGLLMSQK